MPTGKSAWQAEKPALRDEVGGRMVELVFAALGAEAVGGAFELGGEGGGFRNGHAADGARRGVGLRFFGEFRVRTGVGPAGALVLHEERGAFGDKAPVVAFDNVQGKI